MEPHATIEILRLFGRLPDPRARNTSHRLVDIVVIAVMGVFCGARGWYEIAVWASNHEEWLKTFLALPHGLPSHDTMGRVFASLNPTVFEECFSAWTGELVRSGNKFVAIDGKTLRRSFEHGWSRTPIHMVSAFATENELVLGQIKVDSKENEIIAIPKLLSLMDIRRSTVTIDAMGCQKSICKQIVEQKADYVIALKDNQPTLRDQVERTFRDAQLSDFGGWTHDFTSSVESGHGRIEKRKLWVTTDIADIGEAKDWPGMRSIIMVESTRELREKTTTEVRFYISSHKKLDAEGMSQAVRGHWKIENDLHWVLDVTMGEDACRLRKKHSAENFSRLRRMALNKLRQVPFINSQGKEMKVSLACKQKLCAWDRNFLLKAFLA